MKKHRLLHCCNAMFAMLYAYTSRERANEYARPQTLSTRVVMQLGWPEESVGGAWRAARTRRDAARAGRQGKESKRKRLKKRNEASARARAWSVACAKERPRKREQSK